MKISLAILATLMASTCDVSIGIRFDSSDHRHLRSKSRPDPITTPRTTTTRATTTRATTTSRTTTTSSTELIVIPTAPPPPTVKMENNCFVNNYDLKVAVQYYFDWKESAENAWGKIDNWCTSGITDMSGLFANAYDFNENITAWNTVSVTNMAGMFQNAVSKSDDKHNGTSHRVRNSFLTRKHVDLRHSLW